ncbi:S26 family signal peptidase [Stakelama marina]|uniref:S26 family signal peptidase n=1 Tax=Stakelama marina TaxID=2826939 RepID=UPI0024C25B6A|nr:S26 family signal peptidase [Stakelama marina]
MTGRGPLPLFAWQEQRTALRRARRRAARLCALAAVATGLVLIPIAVRPVPRLVWNASASAPIGLYLVTPGKRPPLGAMVIAWFPDRARKLAARRHYLPANVPAVKHVAAVAGMRVCALDSVITVDGAAVARRLAADARGDALPAWRGCRTLARGQILLLATDRPDSFDGRYFGISDTRDVLGTARLIWAPHARGDDHG